MLRALRLLVLMQILCCWNLWGGTHRRTQNSQLSVGVYNDGTVPNQTLSRAEARASLIYRRAGVELIWLDSPALPPELAVRIIPKSRNLSNDVFGVAFLDANGFGHQADIFYRNISELSTARSPNQADVLGYVMAHEIGHLLLGSNSHAATGIMRRHWDDQQLQLASLGQLAFDRKQIRRIHQRLQGREPAFFSRPFEIGTTLADNHP